MIAQHARHTCTPIACMALMTVAGGCAAGAGGGGEDGEDRTLEPVVEELWTVGGIEAEGWDILSDQISLAFDAEGQLRIFDRSAEKIHLVSADGTHRRSWGDQGEGPGELASPMSMLVWPDGSTAVMDLGKMGYVRFDPEGEWIGDVRLDPAKGLPGFNSLIAHPSGDVLSPGGGIRISTGGSGGASVSTGEEAEGIAIGRYPIGDGEPRTIHRAWDPPTPEGGDDVNLGGGNTQIRIQLSTPVAFQPELHVGVLPDGRVVVADSTTWTLEVLSPDGEVLDTLTRPVSPLLVTEELQEAERARRLAALEEREAGGGGGGGPVGAVMITRSGDANVSIGGGGGFDMSGMLEAQKAQLETMLFAPEVPVIDDLAVDWDGRIWVERTNPDLSGDGPIDIVTASGDYLGTVPATGLRIPVAFGPGGLAAYIDSDEFDVPTVRVVRIGGVGG